MATPTSTRSEKIRRDVRITTIYEGTSEILQNIIGMHRWRLVVKTNGGFYREMAAALRELGTGEAAAMAAESLGETILACHTGRLPREQFVLMELARLAAEVETAVALARKAARAGDRTELLVPCARLHGGMADRDVVVTGHRPLAANNRYSDDELARFRTKARFDFVLETAAGELELMNRISAALESDSVM